MHHHHGCVSDQGHILSHIFAQEVFPKATLFAHKNHQIDFLPFAVTGQFGNKILPKDTGSLIRHIWPGQGEQLLPEDLSSVTFLLRTRIRYVYKVNHRLDSLGKRCRIPNHLGSHRIVIAHVHQAFDGCPLGVYRDQDDWAMGFVDQTKRGGAKDF